MGLPFLCIEELARGAGVPSLPWLHKHGMSSLNIKLVGSLPFEILGNLIPSKGQALN